MQSVSPTVILSGIPGRMCCEISRLLQQEPFLRQFNLAPAGFCEESMQGREIEILPGRPIQCDSIENLRSFLMEHMFPNPVVVDFTTPDAAMENLAAYTSAGVPFVVGTTGYDYKKAADLVRASKSSAVLAPNMAVPIVLVRTALDFLAQKYPGALEGYRLSITESHQEGKKDTSGTAKAMLPSLEGLGLEASAPPIESIRDLNRQRELGVTEDHLQGHGWHWYRAKSATGDVELELSHRVNGRRVYAEGTLRAVTFLAEKVQEGSAGEVFTMEDVLEAGY